MRFKSCRSRLRCTVSAVLASMTLAGWARAATEVNSTLADAAPAQTAVSRQTGSAIRSLLTNITLPDLKMTRQDGASVRLAKELDDGRPVVLNFVYTSCTTVCPLTSQVFSLLQERLGKDRDRVHLVSISIDPEQDTPSRLRAYAQHFHAGKEWDYYTGSTAASVQAQVAFGVYLGDKMTHIPVTLLHTAPGNQWVRLNGLATVDDLYAELQQPLEGR